MHVMDLFDLKGQVAIVTGDAGSMALPSHRVCAKLEQRL